MTLSWLLFLIEKKEKKKEGKRRRGQGSEKRYRTWQPQAWSSELPVEERRIQHPNKHRSLAYVPKEVEESRRQQPNQNRSLLFFPHEVEKEMKMRIRRQGQSRMVLGLIRVKQKCFCFWEGSREEEKVCRHNGEEEDEGGGMMDLAPYGTVSRTGKLRLRAYLRECGFTISSSWSFFLFSFSFSFN